MIPINRNKYLFTVFAAFLFCACALPSRKKPPPAAPVKKEAVVKNEAEIKLSPEDTQKVEILYYKAVGAYSSNDMGAALKYLNEISTVCPSYQPAAELRGKMKSVAGSGQNPSPR